jgi:hypothetical protein
MRNVPRLVRDVGRLDEEIVGGVGEALTRPGDVYNSVNKNIGDMNAFGPTVTRDCFGQNALCRLRWREPCKGGFAP